MLHTNNKREFISLAYDRKYDGVRLVKLPNEEVQQIIKKFQELLPGTKMVHGKASHSESQGLIEIQNKVALTFLTKWCLKKNTACYWLGIPAMWYAINTRINHGTKMSPYEYLYGVKPSGGLATLPIDGKLLAFLSREEDLNRTLEIPQEQMLEFYNQDKSKTAKMTIFTE